MVLSVLQFIIFRCLGNRQSFAARERKRLAMSYESTKAAEERQVAKNQGRRKKKDHTGNIDSMTYKEVQSTKI